MVAIFTLYTSFSWGQTFSGPGGLIPDNGQAIQFPIDVTGLSPATVDTIFGLESVCIHISHPWVSDLRIKLVSPAGHSILLSEALGGDGDNYTQTCFRDDASQSIFHGFPPFTGEFRPMENIGYQNNGQNGNGIWKLYIMDTYPGADQGTLLNWSLTFGDQPGHPFPFTSTHLPILIIETNGQEIPDDPKIMSDFRIIDNGSGFLNHPDDPPAYEGFIGIELRGSSSQSFPKKSYGFETWDAAGNDIDTTLLGLPAESDWILNASYTDKTLMRNTMAYHLWQQMGYYGTRFRYVELMLNGRYKGVYIFSEKIKRDKNRVDIAKLNPGDNSGDKLTGGYIVKIDKQTGSGGDGWVSNFPPPVHPNGQVIYFQYEYPKSEDISEPQKAYIQDYIHTFESTLEGPNFAHPEEGWRKYAVEQTFFDYFIVNEYSKNVDGYRLSTFLHKERDSRGGKIRMGPVWDYDLAWHNADYCEGGNSAGWAYQFPCPDDWWQIPFWWQRLLEDPVYVDHLNCRWQYLRENQLSEPSIHTFIDSIAGLLEEPQQRNFEAWPILGIYVWPNPWPYPATYAEEITSLKSWISARLSWLDANMPGSCSTTILPENAKMNIQAGIIEQGTLCRIQTDAPGIFQHFTLRDAGGREMMSGSLSPDKTTHHLNVSTIRSGFYLLTLKGQGYIQTVSLIKSTR